MTDDDIKRIWAEHGNPSCPGWWADRLPAFRDIAKAAVNECATAIEDQRHKWEEAAQAAGDRRDWDGTDNYEAMAEAAARLEGIVRSRSTPSPHGEG